MSFNIFSSGVSGLVAYQSALATVSHNIANASTPGYSRQQVLLEARPGQSLGSGVIGAGVQVSGIRRVYDQFLAAQTFAHTNAYTRIATFHSMSVQLDNMLADPDSSVSAAMQSFFNSMQDVASDPASLPAREVALGEARALVDRFQHLDSRMRDLANEVNRRLESSVREINEIAGGIARINEDIVRAQGAGGVPNDLYDQRDQLIRQLNEHVEVSTVTQDDGSLNVFVGNGLTLVRGFQSETLGVTPNARDPQTFDVSYLGAGGNTDITSSLRGGIVGGALDFRRDVLEPARSELGQIALGFAMSFNAQHAQGTTLDGQLGGDFFNIGGPVGVPALTNSGTATATVDIADLGALTGQDYEFTFTGGGWDIRDAATGAAVAFTGSGTAADPFLVGGVSVVMNPGAAVGDSFLVRPTANVIDGMSVAFDSPNGIAAAAPIRTVIGGGNIGDATISAGTVTDVNDPNLLDPVTIEFIDADNYTVNGAGPFPYTSGDPIEFNGWSVDVTGTPGAGDTFMVEANTGATGDNRNALLLGGLQSAGIFEGGTMSVEAAYDSLVAQVGGETRGASISLDAQAVLLTQAQQAHLAVSGVSLDEEAANLLRFEQAYSAAAEVLRVADELFDTLINSVR